MVRSCRSATVESRPTAEARDDAAAASRAGQHARRRRSSTAGSQAPVLRITAPAADIIINGRTTIEASIDPPAEVQSVNFFVDGRLLCSIERPPLACTWDPGDVVRGHHLRVVATLADGKRLDRQPPHQGSRLRRTCPDRRGARPGRRDPSRASSCTASRSRTSRCSKTAWPSRSPRWSSDEAPLELVLAIDISGSMESSLGEVKAAVKQFLSKLRPGDAATLLGFNDTTFTVAEREKDRKTREDAVDLLSVVGWHRALRRHDHGVDFVSRETGRKGVVIFSDGEDRHSLTRRDAAMRRVQSSDAMLYTVGFGAGASVSQLRSQPRGLRAIDGRAAVLSAAVEGARRHLRRDRRRAGQSVRALVLPDQSEAGQEMAGNPGPGPQGRLRGQGAKRLPSR